MPIVTTKTGRKVLKKAESMCLIPYVYDDTTDINDYVLGDTIYDISAIIGDSITLEQSDGDTQTKENEFTGDVIVKNVTSGEWAFSAQCLDLQNTVLQAIFGAYYNSEVGISAIRKDYETMYALIRIRFKDNDTPDVYLPKVALNSKLMLNQMKTRGSQGNINGTAMSRMCAVIKTMANPPAAGFLESFTDITSIDPVYQVETPVLFVPKTSVPLFLNHYEEDPDPDKCAFIFDEISFSTISQENCFHNRVVLGEDLSQYSIYTD